MLQVYFSAIQPYILPFVLAFGLTFILTVLALRFFPKMKLMDKPHLYGLKRAPIPYSGGLIFGVVFFICVAAFLEFDKHIIGLLIALAMILVVSFLDDLFRLGPFVRLFVQFLAAATIVLSGIGIDAVTNPLGGLIPLDTVQIPVAFQDKIYHFTVLADVFTLFWIIAVMNTINWLDGVPGLASGVSAIASFMIFLLSIRPDFHSIDQTGVASLAVVVFGIAAAFWFFDFPSPRILMGDTGSMFLGFILAVLAIFSGGKIATAFLIMGLPLLDFAWVIGRRFFQGGSIFRGDLSHFHHRLLRAGFTPRETLAVIYVICVLFGGIALFLTSKQKLFVFFLLIVVMIVLGRWVVRQESK